MLGSRSLLFIDVLYRDLVRLYPPKFKCWNLILNIIAFRGRAYGRWLGQEGEALMNRISARIKEAPESSLTPSAYEDIVRDSQLGSGLSPDTKSASTLILDFTASTNMRINFYQ